MLRTLIGLETDRPSQRLPVPRMRSSSAARIATAYVTETPSADMMTGFAIPASHASSLETLALVRGGPKIMLRSMILARSKNEKSLRRFWKLRKG
jgi:hypothetical protein